MPSVLLLSFVFHQGREGIQFHSHRRASPVSVIRDGSGLYPVDTINLPSSVGIEPLRVDFGGEQSSTGYVRVWGQAISLVVGSLISMVRATGPAPI